MIELVCEGGDSKWLGEATRASREQLKTRGFHHDELERFIIVCASCATKLSVLRLIGEERSETLSWASRRPLALHRGGLIVWATGARSLRRMHFTGECLSKYHRILDVTMLHMEIVPPKH